MRSPISFLSCLLPWRLTPCRPPGHWAEPGIARPVEARCDPAKAFIYPPYTGHTPDLLTRLPRHSSEETEISLSKKRPLVHMLSLGFPALQLDDPDKHRWVKGEERRAGHYWGRPVCAADKTGGDDTCTMCSFSNIQDPAFTFPPTNMACCI